MIIKEILWNFGLLLFGFFLILIFNLKEDNYHGLIAGWGGHGVFFTRFTEGLVLGSVIIILRYIVLGIQLVSHKELKTLLFLVLYFIPVLFVLMAYYIPNPRYRSISVEESNSGFIDIPFKTINRELTNLREIGFFKSLQDKSNIFLTELVIGKMANIDHSLEDGRFWERDTKTVNILRLILLDREKALRLSEHAYFNAGDFYYEKVLKGLIAISENNFQAEKIKEKWLSNNQVELSFKVNSKEHQIILDVKKYHIDFSTMINYINNLMQNKDFKFYYFNNQATIEQGVIGLTKSEKQKLDELIKIDFK